MTDIAMYRVRIFVCLMLSLAQAHVLAQTVKPETAATADASTEPRLIRGNDKIVAPTKLVSKIEGAPTSFRFEDAPIIDVVHLVLRDLVKADYVVHGPLTGSVTLATRAEVTPDQAILLMESALQANGIQMARDSRGAYHIGRPDMLKGIVAAPRLVGVGPLPPGSGAIIVPLQYIGAAEMAAILKPLAPPDAILRVDTTRNLLILAGTRTQAEGWLDLVSTFDINLLQGMSVGVFPLKYASVAEVELALKMIAPPSAGAGPTTPNSGAQASGATAAATGSAASSALSASAISVLGAVKILPIARINSILVVSPRAAYLDEARLWIERLDRPGMAGGEAQLFVYAVQNGSARHLANVLNGIFGRGGSTASSANSGVAPALASATASTGTGNSFGFGQSAGLAGGLQSAQTNRQTSPQGTGVTSVNLESGLRVVADEINNAVLIYGSRSEYLKIEATLKKLDVPPTQVLIEASIIEVTLGDDLKYGLQWVFSDPARGPGALSGNGVLSTVGGGVLGAATAGFSYTVANPLGSIRAVLNALAEKSLVNVISSPSMMVLDNHTASISVGNQQPIQAGQTITTGGVISNNIQYKDTGVSLSVTPSVNAGNIVTMQVNQAVTDVGQIDSATLQRAFLQRQFSSKVAVRSGESLVLGGLIRDNTTTSKSGLPFLQDIPLVGNLFGTNGKNVARTELIVVITPRVVRTDQDMREVSGELRERMKGLRGVNASSLPGGGWDVRPTTATDPVSIQ